MSSQLTTKYQQNLTDLADDYLLSDYDLSPQQKIFVLSYLQHFNKTRAAFEAGYSKNTSVTSISDKPEVKRAIEDLIENETSSLGIHRLGVLRAHAAIAFADPRKLFDENDNQLLISEIPNELAAAIENIDVTIDSQGNRNTKIKFASKTKSLEILSKYLGIIEQNTADFNVNINGAPALVIDMIGSNSSDSSSVVSVQ